MTLQDLKYVLDDALEAAYERRDKLVPSAAHGEAIARAWQNIELLQDLHKGVIETLKAQEKRAGWGPDF